MTGIACTLAAASVTCLARFMVVAAGRRGPFTGAALKVSGRRSGG